MDALKERIYKLIEMTTSKKISWMKAGTEAFRWQNQNPIQGTNVTTTIQKQALGITGTVVRSAGIQLVVSGTLKSKPVSIVINSIQNPELKDDLNKLFVLISSKADEAAAEILDDLFDSIN